MNPPAPCRLGLAAGRWVVLASAWLAMLMPVPGHAADGDYVPGQVLVRWRDGVTDAQRLAVEADAGVRTLRTFAQPGLHLLELAPPASVEEAVRRLSADPRVLFAEPNYKIRGAAVPNDPEFPQQWSLRNTGQTGGTPGADIDAVNAWDLYRGNPTLRIGVLDTGIEYDNPDLLPNIWNNGDEVNGETGLDDDVNGYVDDLHGYDFVSDHGDARDNHGHGTFVAGIIGARGNNALGITGVNWSCRMVSIKVLNSVREGSVAWAIAGLEYAMLQNVRVACAAWTETQYSQALLDAIDAAGAGGMLFVAAAGNDTANLDVRPIFPAAFDSPYILTVAATDSADRLAPFSNYGALHVDVAAPGVDMLTTYGIDGLLRPSGTSYAAGVVAGIAALTFGRFPGLGPLEVRELVIRSVDPIPSLAGKVASGGRVDARATIADADLHEPGAITDLTASQPSTNTIMLSWTATGDDTTFGTAARYDLRYATTPITPASFATADTLPAPVPAPSGTPQSTVVGDLVAATDYYFAIKAIDEAGNAGPLSNVATARTLGSPRIEVEPDRIGAALLTGGTATATLRIKNVGLGTLDFSIPTPQLYGIVAPPPALDRPGPGAPVLESAGGPDGFGYRWVDSDDPHGPTFGWIDLTGASPLALTGNDATTAPIPMGMEFPFYGTRFDRVIIGTNGYLAFATSGLALDNQPLPSVSGLPSMVAPMWDDFDLGTTPRIYARRDGERFVVSWVGVTHAGGTGGAHTFQAVLYPTGEIRFHYLTLGALRNSATVGVQNHARNLGFSVVANADYLHDSLAVRIRPVWEWLSVTPAGARVPEGDSVDVEVRIDAHDLPRGGLHGVIAIHSNDTSRPRVEVPVHLYVLGEPDVAVSPDSAAFDTVLVGEAVTCTLTVRNRSQQWLRVRSVTADDPAITITPSSFYVGPDGVRPVVVRYAPVTPGARTMHVAFWTNDPDRAHWVVPLSAIVLASPVLDVAPESLLVRLYTGDSTHRAIRILNAGGSRLRYDVTVEHEATGGGLAPERAGGPDAFGYTFDDSDEPGGPAFHWVDIATTGTLIPMTGDDANSGPHPIGFPFPFYGATFTSFRVCTNGFLSLTSAQTNFTNLPLPNAAAPEYLIAPMWDDLSMGGVPRIRYQTDGESLVVTFQNLTRWGEVALNTFQVILKPSGEILYQYQRLATPHPDSCTVGIQNGARNDGLVVVHDAPYLHANLAVRIRLPREFLRVRPEAGFVAPGDSVLLDARVATQGLLPGTHHATVHIASNDPLRPRVDVPVRLELLGAGRIAIDPNRVDFGDVFLGTVAVRAMVIENTGTAPLEVGPIDGLPPGFSVSTTALTLGPGERDTIEFRFAPASAGSQGGAVRIVSNDPGRPRIDVPISGRGVPPPVIRVAPDSLRVSLANGLGPERRVATRKLAIGNDGGSNLHWSLVTLVPEPRALPAPAFGAPAAPAALALETALDVQPPKGAPDATGGFVGSATGGPDAFGYRWTDSDEPGAPPFGWIDASASGSRLALALDEETTAPIALPFPFRFYGASFDSVRVCSNGWLSFTGGQSTYHNVALPNAGATVPANLIAPYWDDIDLRRGGRVYALAESSRFVVEWLDAPRWIEPGQPTPARYTFEAVLHRDGRIDFQYLDLRGAVLNSATVGIQNATKTIGLTVSHNAPYPRNGLRVHVSRQLGWLNPAVGSGITPPGETDSIDIVFDASGLEDGDYRGAIEVRSNDPARPLVTVPVALHVGVDSVALAVDLAHVGTTADPGWIRATSGICDPESIRVASVRLAGEPVAPGAPVTVGDCEAVLRFDRIGWAGRLGDQPNPSLPVELIGEHGVTGWFRGMQRIRWLPPTVGLPPGPYSGGSNVLVSWILADSTPSATYDVWWSGDGGASWSALATGLAVRGYSWTTPIADVAEGWVEVVVRESGSGAVLGVDHAGPFQITAGGLQPEALKLPIALAFTAQGARPARGVARFELSLPEPREVEVAVYDVRGARMRRLASGAFSAGRHPVVWAGEDERGHRVPPGLYFVRLTSPGWRVTQRLVWLP